MGRKVSIKERATTDAALEILKTAKNQNLKAQMVKLLFETDAREKARADAHERQRRAYAHNKELAALGSQIDLLAEKLQAQQDAITLLKAENEKEIETLKHQIAGKDEVIKDLGEQLKKSETALSEWGRNAGEQLSHIVSYVGCPEYDRRVLSRYLKAQKSTESRTAALGVIVSDKSLPQDQRRKLALEIAQHHKDARQRQPLQQFVDEVKSELSVTSDDDLEPDYARWHRSKESDDPVLLLKLASGLEPASTERQSLAHRMLALFYGWTDLNAPGFDGNHWERKAVFDRIRALKKRSIEEVKQTIHAEIENKRSKEDWQALVKNDNQRAEHLVKAAASGSPEGLCELQQYRQCSNCAHASHIDRTHQGKCHHCGRINFGTEAMKWLPVMKLADVPRCMGLFPCIKT